MTDKLGEAARPEAGARQWLETSGVVREIVCREEYADLEHYCDKQVIELLEAYAQQQTAALQEENEKRTKDLEHFEQQLAELKSHKEYSCTKIANLCTQIRDMVDEKEELREQLAQREQRIAELLGTVIGTQAELDRAREALRRAIAHYHLLHTRTGITIEPLADCQNSICQEEKLRSNAERMACDPEVIKTVEASRAAYEARPAPEEGDK